MNAVIQLFANLGSSIAGAIQHTNLTGLGVALQTGLIGGIFVILRKFIKGGFSTDIGGGLFKSITESFEGLTGTLSAMQQKLKADVLEKIAISIGILAASIVALSVIDPKRLDSAMSGLTIAFGELLGAMAILNKITLTGGFLKMPIITASMGALAFAVGVLTLSVLALSRSSIWPVLLQGARRCWSSIGWTRSGSRSSIKELRGSDICWSWHNGNSCGYADHGQCGQGIWQYGSADTCQGNRCSRAVSWSYWLGVKSVPKRHGSNWTRSGRDRLRLEGNRWRRLRVRSYGFACDWQGTPRCWWVYCRDRCLYASYASGYGITSCRSYSGCSRYSRDCQSCHHTFGGMSLQVLAKGIGALALSLGVLAAALLAMEGGLGGAIALTVAAAGLRLLAPAMKSLGQESWGQIAKGMIALAISMGSYWAERLY